jgi:hypothetical protein
LIEVYGSGYNLPKVEVRENGGMEKFDNLTIEQIGAYVYCLLDPQDNPFYIGMGNGNRVFDHAKDALKNPSISDKIEIIKKIIDSGERVRHVIIRHGLDNDTAFAIETALIDFSKYLGANLSNLALGHKSSALGIMTVDEVQRKYHAPPLEDLGKGCVIININRTYRKAKGEKSFYEATRQSWVIDKKRIPGLKYVLSEYAGFIVEVFEVDRWYQIENPNGRSRWAFEGKQAPDDIRSLYLNRRIYKKRGAAYPITYRLSPPSFRVE